MASQSLSAAARDAIVLNHFVLVLLPEIGFSAAPFQLIPQAWRQRATGIALDPRLAAVPEPLRTDIARGLALVVVSHTAGRRWLTHVECLKERHARRVDDELSGQVELAIDAIAGASLTAAHRIGHRANTGHQPRSLGQGAVLPLLEPLVQGMIPDRLWRPADNLTANEVFSMRLAQRDADLTRAVGCHPDVALVLALMQLPADLLRLCLCLSTGLFDDDRAERLGVAYDRTFTHIVRLIGTSPRHGRPAMGGGVFPELDDTFPWSALVGLIAGGLVPAQEPVPRAAG